MDQFSAHLDRGWDLINRGDLAGARVSAEQGVELDAQSPEAHNLLGFVHAAQGDADGALEHYRTALSLDDTFVEAMLNAAEVLIHPIHDFDSAQELIEDALDLAVDSDETADALLIRFDSFVHQGDEARANAVAAELPRGPFENPRLDFLVGRALFEVQDLEGAAPLLRKAVDREPDNGDAHYFLGLLLDAEDEAPLSTLSFLRARMLDLNTPEPPSALPPEHFENRASRALQSLPTSLQSTLNNALLVISDAPGVELVADGVDPRAGLMFDAVSEPGSAEPTVGRIFLYKRNIERMSEGVLQLQDEIQFLVQAELSALFPSLVPENEPPESRSI